MQKKKGTLEGSTSVTEKVLFSTVIAESVQLEFDFLKLFKSTYKLRELFGCVCQNSSMKSL